MPTLKTLLERLEADRARKPTPPTRRKFWAGTDPAKQDCNCCGRHLKDVSVFIDGLIVPFGQWGLMCQSCWSQHGPKISGRATLGLGRGQKYRLEEFNGLVRWWKVESPEEQTRREQMDVEMERTTIPSLLSPGAMTIGAVLDHKERTR